MRNSVTYILQGFMRFIKKFFYLDCVLCFSNLVWFWQNYNFEPINVLLIFCLVVVKWISLFLLPEFYLRTSTKIPVKQLPLRFTDQIVILSNHKIFIKNRFISHVFLAVFDKWVVVYWGNLWHNLPKLNAIFIILYLMDLFKFV